jgi:Rrf2 family protein
MGLVKSYRGTGGGFILGRAADKITLLEVVEAVEGPIIPNRCVPGGDECDRSIACKVHPVWVSVQKQVRDILAGVSLKELANIP